MRLTSKEWSFMRSIALSALTAVLVAGCGNAPVTTLDVSWVAPQPPQASSFKKLLLITVATSEFVQIAVQDQMAADLKARGVNAVASHKYFARYTDAEKARFHKSIDESGADFILVARVTTTSDKTFEDRGMIVGPGGEPLADANTIPGAFAKYAYPGSYVGGADASMTDVTAEASIYEMKGQKLIWSARTRTTNARSTTGAGIAPQYIKVILDTMKKDKLL
jgi:hypothetical protein